MAEHPLVTITRLLGGVILMQGRLGHQVLGQLLVMNSNEVAMAAASVVVAGTTGQRSAVGQIALRTVAPALAVRALLKKQEDRLERQEERLAGRERTLDERRIAIKKENRKLHDTVSRLAEKLRNCEAAATPPLSPPVALLPAASPPATPAEPPPLVSAGPRVPAKRPRRLKPHRATSDRARRRPAKTRRAKPSAAKPRTTKLRAAKPPATKRQATKRQATIGPARRRSGQAPGAKTR
ncbi:MAG: hypothetical protein ABI818_01145 [Acidobacteriota bacterium]